MPLIESRPLPPRLSLDRGSRPPRRTGSAGRPLPRPAATPAAPRRASLPGASAARFVPGRRVRRWLLEGTRVEELLALRLDEVADGRRSPYDVAAEILDQVKAGEGGDAIR